MWESLCYPAQQAAEKALKAVLIHLGMEPPRTHYIEQLIRLLPADVLVPAGITRAIRLTDYAMTARYPSRDAPVTEDEYREAVDLAEVVVRWAQEVIGRRAEP
jgi:HEPN domain-containing protein